MTIDRRRFLSSLGLAALGLVASGCGGESGGGGGTQDLSSLPEGDRLAVGSLDNLAEAKKSKAKGKKKH